MKTTLVRQSIVNQILVTIQQMREAKVDKKTGKFIDDLNESNFDVVAQLNALSGYCDPFAPADAACSLDRAAKPWTEAALMRKLHSFMATKKYEAYMNACSLRAADIEAAKKN